MTDLDQAKEQAILEAYKPQWRADAAAVDRLWAGVAHGIATNVTAQNSLRVKPRRSSFYRLAGYATIAVVMATAGIYYLPSLRNRIQPSPVAPKTYATAPGQRATVTLADGTRATLAPATTLSVAGREVTLSGQALFTVTSDNKSQFTVLANGQMTRVLGTTFSVRAYKDDSSVRVAVGEGKVSVSGHSTAASQQAAIILAAGDVASVNDRRTEILHGQAISSEFAFASGKLIFSGRTLREAIPELERWFNIDVRVTNPELLDVRIRGVFADETISALADILSSTLNAPAEHDGRTLTFSIDKGQL